ncbi:MAG: DUF167 domain-containing protein [Dehalococcoidia bacterium]|jgi:uncharacterized protein (TIGR00251 family)
MKLKVRVSPHAPKDEVIIQGDEYVVRVRAVPQDNKANEAVINLLAKHFKVAKTAVRIISGFSGRHKIIEIRSG